MLSHLKMDEYPEILRTAFDHTTKWLAWCKYWTHVKYHCYIVVISKCDETPAKMYLAKHYTLIMLFIWRTVQVNLLQKARLMPKHLNNEYMWAEMPPYKVSLLFNKSKFGANILGPYFVSLWFLTVPLVVGQGGRHEWNPLIKEDIFGQECGVPSYQDGNINVFFPLLPFLHLIKEDMFGQECPVRATMMKIY